jgi:type II secretory pathway component PulF
MTASTLDDFTALNKQLAALVEAGVPLDLGLSHSDVSLAKELERINTTVVRRVNRGESLSEALQEGDERDVPAAYSSLVQFGLDTGDISSALEGSTRVAESVDESRFAFERAIFYPLLVCMFAYLGLIGFCLYLAPTLENMYHSIRIAPGPGLRALRLLRETLPYWAAIPPIVLLVIIAFWRRSRSQRAATGVASSGMLRWMPGASQIVLNQRCARFAASLAELVEKNVPLDQALSIAGDASGDAELANGSKSLSAAVQNGQLPPDDGAAAVRFPPFLRWAIWHADATTGRAQALEIAARMYREAAQRSAERLHTLAPMVALVMLGGTVTLLYGLTLFVPVVELLRTLAK